MINKIFYSLVLFPHIKYDEELDFWFILKDIIEEQYWLLKLNFSCSWKLHCIFFQHKNFWITKDNFYSTKNWNIFWGNELLLKNIYNLINKIDLHDFNFFNDKLYNRTIPFWVVLTITSKCNIFCYYCFNDIDYEINTRNKRKNEDFNFWRKTIDHLYSNWTRVVILTWWEPMVTSFFWELLDYLKKKNIFVHLNTNWTLLNKKNLERLNKNYSINIMVSMHEFNDKDYYKVNKIWLEKSFWVNKVPNKFNYMFSEKLNNLRLLKYYKNISLEFLTILSLKNILYLDKIYEFWKRCWVNFHNWQFFRLYSTKNNKWASSSMMDIAVNKIYILNKRYNCSYKIVDPVPFCVSRDLEKASQVIDWVLSDTHDVKTIITTNWYVQLMSAYDNNFWNIKYTSIKDIFNSEFVYKQLNNWFLPKECFDCKYNQKCRWWSRMDSNIAYWDYWKLDPIARIENKII